MRLQFFLSFSETREKQTLITKLRFLHPGHRIHNGLQTKLGSTKPNKRERERERERERNKIVATCYNKVLVIEPYCSKLLKNFKIWHPRKKWVLGHFVAKIGF